MNLKSWNDPSLIYANTVALAIFLKMVIVLTNVVKFNVSNILNVKNALPLILGLKKPVLIIQQLQELCRCILQA